MKASLSPYSDSISHLKLMLEPCKGLKKWMRCDEVDGGADWPALLSPSFGYLIGVDEKYNWHDEVEGRID